MGTIWNGHCGLFRSQNGSGLNDWVRKSRPRNIPDHNWLRRLFHQPALHEKEAVASYLRNDSKDPHD